jgi:hypothetical protein
MVTSTVLSANANIAMKPAAKVTNISRSAAAVEIRGARKLANAMAIAIMDAADAAQRALLR